MTPGKPESISLDVALIGCGKMGGALLRGWLKAKIAKHIHVLEPAGLPPGLNAGNITLYNDSGAFLKAKPAVTVCVLAVKPQIMEEVCQSIRTVVSPQALLLSVAAGRTIDSFEKCFGSGQPVVRTVPNTPAAIGKSMTVAVASSHVSPQQKHYADLLLSAVGLVEWVDDEKLIDSATAVSSSSPAYFYYLVETLARAGEKQGLSPALSLKLARETLIGCAALADHDAQTPVETLRKNVTSPNGTTEAALKVLMENDNFQSLLDRAVAACVARAKQLSQ